MEHDLTRGNVFKTIAVFALPYMLSYFLQMLYGMADLYMMGQFSGAAGITAVGNGAQTLYIITVTLVGLVEKMISFLFIVPSSMGATVSALTAQNAGAGKGGRARQVLRCAMTISVVYGCLITVLMWLVAPAFIGFFAKDPAVVAAGTGYMHSYIFDAIFAGIHICFSGFFAAYGKSYIGFAHNVLAVALIRVPGAWLLSNAYSDTLFPMGIASPCGSILSAVICVVALTVLNRRGAFDKPMA